MKFTIKRSEWYRGLGGEHSRLLTPSGRKCCLGFRAEAVGYTAVSMFNVGLPSILVATGESPADLWRGIVTKVDADNPAEDILAIPLPAYYITALGRTLVSINDDKTMDDIEREARLTKIFASVGDEVTFAY